MEENYEPYGKEWEKEMLKMPKKDIVNLFRDQAKKRKQLESAMKVVYAEIQQGERRRALNVAKASLKFDK